MCLLALCLSVTIVLVEGNNWEHLEPIPSPENQGWATFLADEISEFHDLPLTWALNRTVPDWIRGTYAKIGPARKNFGDERYYGNYLDSYGKIHKFTFNGADVKFSGRMVETETYNKSVRANKMVPTISLAKVYPNDWSVLEMVQAMTNGYDNTNVLVYRLGPEDKEKAQYLAVTDYPSVSEIDIDTLAFKRKLEMNPLLDGITGASCAHWRKEIGKDTSLNFEIMQELFGQKFKLYRFGDNYEDREVVGSFTMPHGSMIHMFGLTLNYAIIVVYPVTMDMMKLPTVNMHPFEALYLLEDEPTKIYLINLHDGSVIDGFASSDPSLIFGTHHINAWEEGGEVVFDFSTNPWDAMATYLDIKSLLTHVDTHADRAHFVVKRIRLNLSTKTVGVEDWPNALNVPLHNTLDFCVINFDYDGRKNCYVYGWAPMDYWRQVLVKKDLCDSRNDKTWFRPSHYSGEVWFLPRPGAVEEDDGVILSVMFDGTVGKSYLLLLDGKTFEELNYAYLPHIVPFSYHGNWFPEVH